MAELIDRKYLLAYLAEIKPDEYVSAFGEAAVQVIGLIEEFVKEMPTIDPEVRHGRWIRRETVLDTECKCSVCGYKDFVPKHDNYWFRRKFCPNCGADMREEGADNA